MKMLLDENLPKKLRLDFPEYDVYTVRYMGWSGISNGQLLKLILENDFEILMTFDKNMAYQQNFQKYPIKVCVLNASRNDYDTLTHLTPIIKRLIENTELEDGINIIEMPNQ